MEYLPAFMLLVLTILLFAGFPSAFTLMGTALFFGLAGLGSGFFNPLPLRIWYAMTDFALLAVPLLIFMGMMLERSGLAEELLDTIDMFFSRVRGGLAISVVIVGAFFGASTGIMGATSLAIGVLAVPLMLRRGYQKELVEGTISASCVPGLIIPPSIMLVLIGVTAGVSVDDLFIGALFPGILTVGLYILCILLFSEINPENAPAMTLNMHTVRIPLSKVFKTFIPAVLLAALVPGLVFAGASATEAAAVGAVGVTLFTILSKKFSLEILHEVMHSTMRLSSAIFMILAGASAFLLVFNETGGGNVIGDFLGGILAKHGQWAVVAIAMGLVFIMGFFLDFIAIVFVYVPLFAPFMIESGFDPLWLGILIAATLQTSWIVPLFIDHSKGGPEIKTWHMRKGIVPFAVVQIIVFMFVFFLPEVVTWLPKIRISSLL